MQKERKPGQGQGMPWREGLAVQPCLVAHVAQVAQLWQSPVSFQICSSLPKPPRLGETWHWQLCRWVYYSEMGYMAMTFMKEIFQKTKNWILPLPPPPLSPTPPPPTTRMFIWQVVRATVLRVEVLVITSFDTYFFWIFVCLLSVGLFAFYAYFVSFSLFLILFCRQCLRPALHSPGQSSIRRSKPWRQFCI